MAIDYNAQLPDVSNYTRLPDGSYITNEEYQNRLNSGEYQTVNIDPNQNAFSRGLSQGVAGLKADIGGGLKALAGDIIGSDSMKQGGIDYYNKQQAISNLYAKPSDQLNGVNSLSDLGSYIANQAGQAAPNLIGAIGTGLLGGGVRVGAERLLAKQVAKDALSNEISNLATQEVAKSALAPGLGFNSGLFGFGAAQTSGQIYPEAVKNGSQSPITNALVGGAIGGALNLVGEGTLVGNALDPVLQSSNIGTRLLANTGLSAGVNALTGVAGEVNQRAFTNQSLTNNDAINSYINAGVAGGVIGAPFGLPSLFKGKADTPLTKPEIDTVRADEQRQIQNTPEVVNTVNDSNINNVNDNSDILNNQNTVQNEQLQNNSGLTNETNALDTISRNKIPEINSNIQEIGSDIPNINSEIPEIGSNLQEINSDIPEIGNIQQLSDINTINNDQNIINKTNKDKTINDFITNINDVKNADNALSNSTPIKGTPEQINQQMAHEQNMGFKTDIDIARENSQLNTPIENTILDNSAQNSFINTPIDQLGIKNDKLSGMSINDMITKNISDISIDDANQVKSFVDKNITNLRPDLTESQRVSYVKDFSKTIDDAVNAERERRLDFINNFDFTGEKNIIPGKEFPIVEDNHINSGKQDSMGALSNSNFIDRVNSDSSLNKAYQKNPALIESTFKSNKDSLVKIKDLINKGELQGINSYEDYVKTGADKISNNFNDITSRIATMQSYANDTLKNSSITSKVITKNEIPANLRKNIDGYYDPNLNQIVLVADRIKSIDQVKALLNHELLHGSIYNALKKEDRQLYESHLDKLSKNENLKNLANQLSQQAEQRGNPLTKYEALEEALAKMAETGEYRNLTGIKPFIDFLKNTLNKLLGTDTITDAQVQDYLTKTIDYGLNDADAQKVNETSISNSRTFVNDTGNMPHDIMYSEFTPEENKDFFDKNSSEFKALENKVKELSIGIQAEMDLRRSNDGRGALNSIGKNVGRTISERLNYISGSISENKKLKQELIKQYPGEKDKINKLYSQSKIKVFGDVGSIFNSVREMASKYDLTQMLQDVFDQGDTVYGFMKTFMNQDIRELNNKTKKMLDFDNQAVNVIMTDFGLQQNDGNGIRPSDQQVRDALVAYKDSNGKKINNLNSALELYNIRRANADKLIDKETISKSIDIINRMENTAQKGGASLDIISNLRDEINNAINTDNATQYKQKINDLSKENNPFNMSLDNPELSNMSSLQGELRNLLDVQSQAYNNGYIPKDHSGKYLVKVALKAIDSEGKVVNITHRVEAFDNTIERYQYKQAYEKLANEMVEKGLIKNIDDMIISAEDRVQETTSNLNASQFINQAERNGVPLTEEQKRQILSTNKTFDLLDRSFKTGVGYSLNIDKATFALMDRVNSDISRAMFHNKEVSILQETRQPGRGPERAIAIDMLNQKNAPKQTGDELTGRLRSWGSLWFLGGNVSSALLQVVQFMQSAPSWLSQYSGGLGTSIATKNIGKAYKYIRTGTTGDLVLDKMIKSFNPDMIGANMNEMLFNIRQIDQFGEQSLFNKAKNWSFKLFGGAEMLNRVNMLLASYDIYNNPELQKGTKKPEGTFEQFATQNLIRVNGDYSAYNRSKILRGPVAQTLFMFQQYKIFMAEMFKHMDTQAKAKFIGSLALSGGMMGLPFAQDAEDMINFLCKVFNIPFSVKKEVNDFYNKLGQQMGVDGLDVYARNGIFPSLGTRVGVGNVIPGFGGVLNIASGSGTASDVANIGGPTLSLFVNTTQGVGSLFNGSISSALKQVAPGALKNIIKGGQQAVDGYSLNQSGTAVSKQTNWWDNANQFFGFQTASMISQSQNQQIIQNAKDLKKSISSHFRDNYLRAELAGDKELSSKVIADAREFNRQAKIANSGFAFNLNIDNWKQQAKDNQKPATDRAIKSLDKNLKAEFKNQN